MKHCVTFTVRGIAIQKGSARAFTDVVPGKNGVPTARARVVSDTRRDLKGWERDVKVEAIRAKVIAGKFDLEGPKVVELLFVLPTPKKAKGGARYHLVKPDIDKLARAAIDGMTGVCWADDKMVVSVTATKVYTADEPPHMIAAVHVPDCIAELWSRAKERMHVGS